MARCLTATVLLAVNLLFVASIPLSTGQETSEDQAVFYMSSGVASCTEQSPQNVSCHSLEDIASRIANMSGSVKIVIQDPNVELRTVMNFSNLSAVELIGNPSSITCVSEENGSHPGFILESVENITIKSLTVSQCGALRNYTAWDNSKITARAVFHIVNPTHVTATDLRAVSNHGVGLFMVHIQGGTVDISNSYFENNTVPDDDLYKYAGGGGILVRQSQYPGIPSEFVFRNCVFTSNRASTHYNYTFISTLVGTGRGGGLDVILLGQTAFNEISVSNCSFSRNSAFLGAGLAIQIQDFAHNNSVAITNCTFEENGCEEGWKSGSGGGAHFGYSYYREHVDHATNNNFRISNSTFKKNCAELGGGSTFFSSPSEIADFNNNITFTKCLWIENSAHIGAAMDISPHSDHRLSGGFLPSPVFTDCQFISNRIVFIARGLQQEFGSGTLFSSSMDVQFISTVDFTNNCGSAFIIVNGIVDFSLCTATFTNNTGIQGGAIALIGFSSMFVGPGTSYTFTSNRATDVGGAIYTYWIDPHDFIVSQSCFIQYAEQSDGKVTPASEWNTTFIFKDNSAVRYGHSIYATSLISCQLRRSVDQETHHLWSTSEIFRWPNVFIYDDEEIENQIATDGANFMVSGSLPFHIIPGEEHKLDVSVADDLNQTIDTTFRASIEGESEIEVDDAFSCVSSSIIQLRGDEGKSGKLLLQTVSPRKSSIIVDVILKPCPPGFSFNEENECTCDTHSYIGFTRCNSTKFHAHLAYGFWAGYISNGSNASKLVTGICPVGFCNYNGSGLSSDVPLPHTANQSVLDETVCGLKRTGVLCGGCTPGHSVYFHSPSYSCEESRLCNIGWLFYILSELIPLTILFIIVLVLNISFTSGAINGFILFSQLQDTLLIDASGVVEVPQTVVNLRQGYRLIYGFFNLDFFAIESLSFCLWEGTNVLDVLAFKYVTVLYAMVLVIGVIMFMKYCGHRMLRNLRRRFRITKLRSSVIHGLSTFIILCYVQCIKVSLNILIPATLRGRGGVAQYPRRVWLNGEFEILRREHLPYALPAILCLLTLGAIPPILLLSYPLINRVLAFCGIGESKPVMLVSRKIPMNKLKPFLDSFQGCFKDELRFFAGLYFLYRWIGLLVYSIAENLSIFYMVVECILIAVLFIHAVAQPYQTRWHNIVDAFLLAILAFTNGLTGFIYYYSRTSSDDTTNLQFVNGAAYFQLVLIYLPIIYAVAYVVIKTSKKLNIIPRKKQERQKAESISKPVARHVSMSVVSVSDPFDEYPARLLADYEEMEDNSSPFKSEPEQPIPPSTHESRL